MIRPGRDRLRGNIERNETYVGGPEEGLRGRKIKDKSLALVAAEREGRRWARTRMRVIEDLCSETILEFVRDSIEPGSVVRTDGLNRYLALPLGPAGKLKIKTVKGSKTGILDRETVEYLSSQAAIAGENRKTILIPAGASDHAALRTELLRCGLDDEYVSVTGSTGERTDPEKLAGILTPKVLNGVNVVILADNDETGRKAAEKWARFCLKHGAHVKIVFYPEEIDGKLIKDTRDFFLAGKTFDDLRALMDAAPVLTEDDFPPDDSNATAAVVKVVEAGEIEPISGKFVLDKDRTRPTARAFVEKYYTLDGIKTLRFKDSQFYTWSDNRYIPLESNLIQKQAFDFLSDALIARNYGGTTTYEPFPAKDSTVKSALDAIQHETFLESDAPVLAWLGEEPSPVADPSMIIFGKTKNGSRCQLRFFCQKQRRCFV